MESNALVGKRVMIAEDEPMIIFVDGGVIVEQGPPAQLIAQSSSERLKLFLRRYQGDYFTA